MAIRVNRFICGRPAFAPGVGVAGTAAATALGTSRDAVAKLEKRAFHREEQNRSGGVDAEFDGQKSGHRRERDIVIGTELRDEMDDKLLNEISAVGYAGDKRGAG